LRHHPGVIPGPGARASLRPAEAVKPDFPLAGRGSADMMTVVKAIPAGEEVKAKFDLKERC
jgi:hypothetical protein